MSLHRFSFRAMAASNEIQVHHADAAVAKRAADAAIAEVARIEAKYSRYKADSVVSRINAAAGAAPVPIDEETRALLLFADACWQQSQGLFDATSGVLRRAWDFNAKHVPSTAELAPLLRLVGWSRVELTETTVRLPLVGMELDFGGFGKEYAVDRAALFMQASGVKSALVNLAGDLAALGPQPGDAPWRVGIRHPRRDGELIASLDLLGGAIATSGDYERFMEVDGVRHCHILDPRTGRSARGLQSVTVYAPSCLVAGSATTVAMLKGAREGIEWLEELTLPYMSVAADGRVDARFGDKIQVHSRTS